MKKHLKNLLALLLCAALLCGAFGALADEVEIEIEETEVDGEYQIEGVGLALDELDLEPNNVSISLEDVSPVSDEVETPVSNGLVSNGFDYNIDENNVLWYFYADENQPPVHFDIPEGVVAIDDNVFNGRNIKSVSIPASVTQIGDSAFCNTPLESITIPGTVKTVGYDAFRDCKNLKTATIMNGVESLGHSLFIDCTSLERVYIPGSVKELEYQSFQGCTALTDITIEEGVEKLGSSLFYECRSLETITIPGSVKDLQAGLFKLCTSLKKVTLCEGVQSITSQTFGHSHCVSLTEVIIPGSMKTICADAFSAIPALKKVTIGEGVEAIGYHAFNCRYMGKIVIPASVTKIDSHALGYNKYNKKVEGFVICGKAGTAAEKYANENGFEFDDGTVKPNRITITNGKKATVKAGKTLQLKTKLYPAKAKTKLTWESSNTKVATVSGKGLVKGIKAGKAKITVKTANGKKATITITVK